MIQFGQVFPCKFDTPIVNLAFIADRAGNASAHIFAVPIGGVMNRIVFQHFYLHFKYTVISMLIHLLPKDQQKY